MSSQAAELARRLARDAEAVCRHYLSNGRRQGRYWLVGDVTNTTGPQPVRPPDRSRKRQGRRRQVDRICSAESYVAHLRLGAVSPTIDSFYAT